MSGQVTFGCHFALFFCLFCFPRNRLLEAMGKDERSKHGGTGLPYFRWIIHPICTSENWLRKSTACSSVRERPKSRPGRVRAGRHRNKMAPQPSQPAAVRVHVEHETQKWISRQTSGFFFRDLAGLVFSTTVIAMMERGKVQMERTGKDYDRRAQLPLRET